MKAATSSLNASAESYVPLSKRGAFNGQKEFLAVEPHLWYPAIQAPQNIHNLVAYNTSLNSGPMGNGNHHSLSLSNSNPSEVVTTDKASVDEVFEYNLAYLQESFPGMSYESLSHVYVANNCDIDATVDMLSHLEHFPGSPSEKLPYSLDIGDVAETGVANELPFQKMKDVNNKTGAAASSSSSGVSG